MKTLTQLLEQSIKSNMGYEDIIDFANKKNKDLAQIIYNVFKKENPELENFDKNKIYDAFILLNNLINSNSDRVTKKGWQILKNYLNEK